MDFFETLVWDVIAATLLQSLFTAIPFLGWGPIGIIVTFIASKIFNAIYSALALFVETEAIILRNEMHQKAFNDASVQLKIIAQEKGLDSPEFITARDTQKTALAAFIKFS